LEAGVTQINILIITGSPHRHGTSDLLASEFTKGAEEAGHSVRRFDAAFGTVTPCIGCKYCGMSGPCRYEDDMAQVLSQLLDSDMVVLATPLYFFGMSAQLKLIIDRFRSDNRKIQAKQMDAILLATSWDAEDWTMEALAHHFEILCKYERWNNRGMVLGLGCGNLEMMSQTDYAEKAYQLGRTLV